MMWVREAPKVSGWYWAKRNGLLTGQTVVRPVHIYRSSHEGDYADTIYCDGENSSADSNDFSEFWDERIKEPNEQ